MQNSSSLRKDACTNKKILEETPVNIYTINGSSPLTQDAEIIEGSERVSYFASNFFERMFDILLSVAAILVLLPIIIILLCLIKCTSRGPAIYIQHRIGKNEVVFPCLKLRSMFCNSQEMLETLLATSEAAKEEWARDQKLRNDPRITRVGAFLRKTRLDEIPQLFNVMMGQMSIVGPRPITKDEISRYGSSFSAYCSVRPGLTGLWQVSGRSDISYEKRVQLDEKYVSKKSVKYDFFICLKTIPIVLNYKGAY